VLTLPSPVFWINHACFYLEQRLVKRCADYHLSSIETFSRNSERARPQLICLSHVEQLPILKAGDLVFDSRTLAPQEAILLATQYRQQQINYIEVHWPATPFGIEYGFLLTVGADEVALSQAKPLLDMLAPTANGWLHAGPVGSANYLISLFKTCLHNLQSFSTFIDNTPSAHWLALFKQQQQLAQQLATEAENYLNSCENNFSASTSAYLKTQHYPAQQAANMIIDLARSCQQNA